MSTLLVDNYDSYTYNVFQLIAAASGEEPIVVPNDALSWTALRRVPLDAIVLSPGPGRPERWHDFGVCADILRSSDTPVLGICLGHQGLGRVLDGTVASAPIAMHGRLSRVRHLDGGLFAGIPQDFSVVRYHSLAVTGPLGPEGRVTAWTEEGVVMGVEHCRRPLWGVQFHPESIATEHGLALFENFYTLAQDRRPRRSAGAGKPRTQPQSPPRARRAARAHRHPGNGERRLLTRTLAGEPDAERLFEQLFATVEYAFWLDSADAPTRLAQCSYLGTSAGRGRCVLEYDVQAREVVIGTANGKLTEHGSIFDVLDREISQRATAAPSDLAGGLLGGFVGYIGYECKADCGSPNAHSSDLPDAVLMLADRVIAIDHRHGSTKLFALCDDDDAEALRWLEQTERVVMQMPGARSREPASPQPPASNPMQRPRSVQRSSAVRFECGRGREQYLADIARCQTALAAGESYEVCLTDQIATTARPEPFELYRRLRRINPAPFAAYLKLGEIAVLSSSPERFLSVDRDRRVQTRPIKGTVSRAQDSAEDERRRETLARDEKTYAEHLMIVDLLRNDLGRVCEVGSVHVPDLMVVEPYATVHQLVSTVSGVLESGRTPVECVRACFPGGSMTGAPKLRTMEIIDGVERCARGVYSGALGYFGLDGSVDLSIVIRTVVMRPGATTIGAGGAIVMQSDPQEEFDELLLKARAPMTAIAQVITGRDDPDALSIELEPRAVMADAA